MKKLATVAGLAALTLLNTSPGFSQTSDEMKALREEIGTFKEVQELRREVEGLKAGQQGLQKDLEEIKTLLRSRPAAAAPPTLPPNLVFNTNGEPSKGEKTAKLALIEFTDYQ